MLSLVMKEKEVLLYATLSNLSIWSSMDPRCICDCVCTGLNPTAQEVIQGGVCMYSFLNVWEFRLPVSTNYVSFWVMFGFILRKDDRELNIHTGNL